MQSVLVGIICPEEKLISKWASELGINEMSFEGMCKDERIIQKVKDDIAQQQKVSKFKGFERIVHIRLDHMTFESRGLMTTTFKIKRADTKEFYRNQIWEMYEAQGIIEKERAQKAE